MFENGPASRLYLASFEKILSSWRCLKDERQAKLSRTTNSNKLMGDNSGSRYATRSSAYAYVWLS
jgi:hypothetical protein